MKVDFIDIILLVIFFQLLAFIPFLLFSKGNRSRSNRILAIFLFAKALCVSHFFSLRQSSFFLENFPHIFYVGSSFTLLWGPGLYFYTKSILFKDFNFRKVHLIHILPFIFHLLLLALTFHFHNVDIKRHMVVNGVFINKFSKIYDLYLYSSILIYTGFALKMFYSYRQGIRNIYSQISQIDLSWLQFVLYGFLLKWIFDIWLISSHFFFGNGLSTTLALILSRLTLLVFLNVMFFRSLKYHQIFSGIDEKEIVKKRKSLSEESMQKYLKQLKQYMQKEKPYLDPEINLKSLAEKTDIPARSLSEVINDSFQNFYDFINYYRIKESQVLLNDDNTKEKTIQEIYYQVGYNSKASFNTAFKKITGMTPTQFKNLQLS